MTVLAFVIAIIGLTVVPGCSSGEGSATVGSGALPAPVQPVPDGTEGVEPAWLEVTQFSLTKESLRLDYRMTNGFSHDIWVCANMSHYPTEASKWTVETEICDGILQITRRGNLEQRALINTAGVYAVYHRLPPGASRCDTVLLPLPVENWSHVRFTWLPIKPVVLNQVVLEVGYFREDLRDLLPRKDRSEPYEPSRYKMYRHGYFEAPDTSFISYIVPPGKWDKLHLEQSVQITIPDVNVPGLLDERR